MIMNKSVTKGVELYDFKNKKIGCRTREFIEKTCY